MRNVQELKRDFERWFNASDKVLIALSGGIDSSLVAYGARKILGSERAIAVISASASLKQKDLLEARQFTRKYSIKTIEIISPEMDDANYVQNPVNRCYFCKSALYNELEKLTENHYTDYTILNGNNFSDNSDYRPGIKAAREFKVRSPLAECGFTKEEIRLLSNHYMLPNWNKPASPCLSSRFPYGQSITTKKLKMVEQAENLLNEYGFNDVRVRMNEENASLEVPQDSILKLKGLIKDIQPQILSIGFKYCEIDEEGLVSGKLNRDIDR